MSVIVQKRLKCDRVFDCRRFVVDLDGSGCLVDSTKLGSFRLLLGHKGTCFSLWGIHEFGLPPELWRVKMGSIPSKDDSIRLRTFPEKLKSLSLLIRASWSSTRGAGAPKAYPRTTKNVIAFGKKFNSVNNQSNRIVNDNYLVHGKLVSVSEMQEKSEQQLVKLKTQHVDLRARMWTDNLVTSF